MKNKKLLSTFAIFSIALLSIGMVSAFGPGNGQCQDKGQGMNGAMFEDLSEQEITEMQTFRKLIQSSIEGNNFAEWKSLMESQLTQEKFDKIVERHSERSEMRNIHEQMQEAWDGEDYETVKELREQMPEKPEFKNNGRNSDQGFFHKFRFW